MEKKLPDIMKDFDATDIFNADKNNLFFKALPNKPIERKKRRIRR